MVHVVETQIAETPIIESSGKCLHDWVLHPRVSEVGSS